MATVTLMLKDNKVNSKGEKPLYIRLIKGRKTKFMSLGIKVHPDQWNQEKLRVRSSYPHSGRINALIAKRVAEAEEIALSLEITHKSISSRKIKAAIIGSESPSFLKYMADHNSNLKAKGQIGTYDKYNATYQKLKTFLNNRDLSFEDVDLQFLKSFEGHMRDVLKNKTNTIHGNMKILRKLLNDAVREDIIDPKDNPFSKYKLTWEKTTKEYLTEEELKAIEDLQLSPGSRIWHFRNMYVFAAYAGGIRISDLLQLKWKNYNGTHVTIFTQKTKETISIKLPTVAQKILSCYQQQQPVRKPKDFVFPFLSSTEDYSDPVFLFKTISAKVAYANKNLKEIASLAGITKHISFHTSRHTWATRALRKGMRIEYVSKLLTHSSIKTTQIYAKIVNSELDTAMDIFN